MMGERKKSTHLCRGRASAAPAHALLFWRGKKV